MEQDQPSREAILAKCRCWCFTINNFTQEDIDRIKELIESEKYGIAETEHTGEDEGTPHIQGYISFNVAKRFHEAKRKIGERAHIEPAKGSPDDNFKYCSKENTVFVQKGVGKGMKGPCFLEMWNDMKTMAPEQFADKYPREWYLRREKVERIMIDYAMKSVERYNGDLMQKNYWIWGEPGVGKSRWAENQGTPYQRFKKGFNKWWDGYNLLTTKIVIIEDYPAAPNGDCLAWHMKNWGDRYPFEGEAKGSHLMIEPRRFFLIITSNYPIERCFNNQEDIDAIKRRFKQVNVKQGDMYSQCMIQLDFRIIQ